jgi:hypothetical protein
MNKVPKLDPKRLFPESQHEITNIMAQLNPGTACFVFASILTIFWVLRAFCGLKIFAKVMNGRLLEYEK